ncbi:hypothetical protein [Streptomyces canus]
MLKASLDADGRVEHQTTAAGSFTTNETANDRPVFTTPMAESRSH